MKQQMIGFIFLFLLSQVNMAWAGTRCEDILPNFNNPNYQPSAFEQYCDCEKSRENKNPAPGDTREKVRGVSCGYISDGFGEFCRYANGAKQGLCCDADYETCEFPLGDKKHGVCCPKPGSPGAPQAVSPGTTKKCVAGGQGVQNPQEVSKELTCYTPSCCGSTDINDPNTWIPKQGCCIFDPVANDSVFVEYKNGGNDADMQACCEKELEIQKKQGLATPCDRCEKDPKTGAWVIVGCDDQKCEECDAATAQCKLKCNVCQTCNNGVCDDPVCAANEMPVEEPKDPQKCCICKSSCSDQEPCTGNQTCNEGCCECPDGATLCVRPSECGEGEQCIDGCCKGCEDGSTPCSSDSDCSDSEECKENCCAPKETCDEDDDCGSCETCKKEEGSDTGTCEALECDEEKCEKCEEGEHECKPDPECCFPECSEDEQCCGGTCVPKCCTTCEYNEATGQWESETDENCCCNGDLWCDDETGECSDGNGGGDDGGGRGEV